MAITAQAVKELRERTGAGMMDCKKALTETEGDLEKAAEILRIKGIAKADKKADRVAAEGLVWTFVSPDHKVGAVVEVNCETDFVARGDDFGAFVQAIAERAAATKISDIDALANEAIGDKTIEERRRELIANIGENITLRRAQVLEATANGVVGAYIHGGGSIATLAVLDADKALSGDERAQTLAKDIAMHIAAFAPEAIDETQLPAEVVEKERAVLIAQAEESGKPREIVEKMIDGRIKKWMKDICLIHQAFVRTDDTTVLQEINALGKALGGSVKATAMARFVRGEGIEKKSSNLAEEVAATLG